MQIGPELDDAFRRQRGAQRDSAVFRAGSSVVAITRPSTMTAVWARDSGRQLARVAVVERGGQQQAPDRDALEIDGRGHHAEGAGLCGNDAIRGRGIPEPGNRRASRPGRALARASAGQHMAGRVGDDHGISTASPRDTSFCTSSMTVATSSVVSPLVARRDSA